MVLLRALAAVSAVAWISAVAVGCGGGLSKEDADVRCDQEKAALTACFDDKVYAACEACFEKCGDSCIRGGTCPSTYACPGDTGTGGTATQGTGGSSQ
jgi:hypothetical protein